MTQTSYTHASPYKVLERYEAFEIRQYEPRIVAETYVEGNFTSAFRQGNIILSKYICGYNASKQKISLQGPIEQQPIKEGYFENLQNNGSLKAWLIALTIPDHYLPRLPHPNDPTINLRQSGYQTKAAVTFTGFFTEKKAIQKNKELSDLLEKKRFEPTGQPIFARYDSIWVLPFFRQNEILIEIKDL